MAEPPAKKIRTDVIKHSDEDIELFKRRLRTVTEDFSTYSYLVGSAALFAYCLSIDKGYEYRLKIPDDFDIVFEGRNCIIQKISGLLGKKYELKGNYIIHDDKIVQCDGVKFEGSGDKEGIKIDYIFEKKKKNYIPISLTNKDGSTTDVLIMDLYFLFRNYKDTLEDDYTDIEISSDPARKIEFEQKKEEIINKINVLDELIRYSSKSESPNPPPSSPLSQYRSPHQSLFQLSPPPRFGSLQFESPPPPLQFGSPQSPPPYGSPLPRTGSFAGGKIGSKTTRKSRKSKRTVKRKNNKRTRKTKISVKSSKSKRTMKRTVRKNKKPKH